MRILGEIAVISGSSSGIGAATAKALAARGAHVVLLARRENRLHEVAASIRSKGGKASVYVVDLRDVEAAASIAARIMTEIGDPAILVNNAGAGGLKFIEETSVKEAEAMIAVPYFAAFALTRAFIPEMLRQNRGHILFVNSPASYFPWPSSCAYAGARWALRGFSEALRSDLFRTKICVTHFVAGETETEIWEKHPGSRERLPKVAILSPCLSPAQVGAAIVRAIEKNSRFAAAPGMVRLFLILYGVFPWAINWLVRSTGYARRRQPIE